MALWLKKRNDVEFESYSVRSGETRIGVITRHEIYGQRVWWQWSIGTVYVSGDGHGTPSGAGDTLEEAMQGFAHRWRLWLKSCDLMEITPGLDATPVDGE